jgi:hypothetical protein
MICPRCNSNQTDEAKFCKVCGANLHAVRQALDVREGDEPFDWSRTWVAEMFMSAEEHKRRKLLMERERGVTPALRRYNEIKAGVITVSVGVGVASFLFLFFNFIIARGGVFSADAAAILSSVWVAGLIPIFVGLGLIANGVIVSKKIVELQMGTEPTPLEGNVTPPGLRAPNTNEFTNSPYSVTEGTTKHLKMNQK